MPRSKPVYVTLTADNADPYGTSNSTDQGLVEIIDLTQILKEMEDVLVLVDSGENGIVYTQVVPQLKDHCSSAPVTVQWLLGNFEMGIGVSLPRSSVYYHYIHHCLENKMGPVNAASFGKLMRSVFYGLKTRRLGTRGHSRYHYYGLQYKFGSSLADVDESIIESYANEHGLNGPSLRSDGSTKRRNGNETVEELLRKRVKMDLYSDWPEDLVRLGLSVKEILKNEQKIFKMRKGIAQVDLEQIFHQAFQIARCKQDKVVAVMKEIEGRLTPGTTIHDWTAWVDRISNLILSNYINTPQLISKSKELAFKWSYFSSLLLRDLTLQCCESFGLFILLNQFIADYLMYTIKKLEKSDVGKKIREEAPGFTLDPQTGVISH